MEEKEVVTKGPGHVASWYPTSMTQIELELAK
jgi:hypothetical protein